MYIGQKMGTDFNHGQGENADQIYEGIAHYLLVHEILHALGKTVHEEAPNSIMMEHPSISWDKYPPYVDQETVNVILNNLDQ